MKRNSRAIGYEAEEAAAIYLAEKGYKIVCRNYYSRYGEVDIVAYDGETLTFVEVKFRKSAKFGTPAEAVTYTKRKRIINTTRCYLFENNIRDVPVRFDVVEVYGNLSINIIKGAFVDV